MAVPNRYILHQGPVLGALARAAWMAAQSARGVPNQAPTEVPGPKLTQTIPPRPKDLVRDYIRNVGGDPAAYRGQVPPHLFPQWVFPLQARSLEGIQYPMQKVLNFGCRMEINAPLSLGRPFDLTVQLEDIDDNGKRAIIHQRTVTGTSEHPEALVAHVYAFVPLGGRKEKPAPSSPTPKGNGKPAAHAKPKTSKKDRPGVPQGARELARWNLHTKAGLEFAKLTGDFNPIHWIPPAARAAGFRNVILHGFATLARAIEGMNRGLYAGDPSRLAMIDVRFTKPLVLPANVGLYIDGEQVFVGNAPGGPAYLAGTFATKGS